MNQRFLFKKNECLERTSKGKAETRLLARSGSIEILKQTIAKGSTFYLDSALEWKGFEFLYVLEGRLKYLATEQQTLIEPGDYIAREFVEERSWFTAECDTVLLYISSESAFNVMRDEVAEFHRLARQVELDEYLDGHCRRLEQMAKSVGHHLNLSGEQLYNLSYAAFFHDIGKAKVPVGILQKPGELTASEWGLLRKHTLWGREMLEVKDFLKTVACIVGQTHERVDGKGYPDGLTSAEIMLEAKIIAVVDTYDAMTTDRPYRKALTKQKAISELRKNAGTQFDPTVVDAFLQVI